MHTQSPAEQSDKPDFGIKSVDNALRILWDKVSDQLSPEELKWFAGLSDAAAREAKDLANATESLYCHAMAENDVDDFSELLLTLSHCANAVAGIADIGASAADRLINPEYYITAANTTNEAVGVVGGEA